MEVLSICLFRSHVRMEIFIGISDGVSLDVRRSSNDGSAGPERTLVTK